MRILVFGGTGYIGSHTCVELAARGHDLVIADNLSNSSERVLARLQTITGQAFDFRRVESELFRDPSVPKGRLNINAEHGVVVLRGVTDSPDQIRTLEVRACGAGWTRLGRCRPHDG